MRALFYVPIALVLLGLAGWAYRENYRTQEAMARVQSLQRQIAEERAALAVLNAEWAYLNRPDRLHTLAEINFDRLELFPLKSGHFGRVDQVIRPQPDEPGHSGPITGPATYPAAPDGIIELSATGDASR